MTLSFARSHRVPTYLHHSPHMPQIKSIVNTKFVRGTSSDPHHFEYAAGASAVTLAGEQVTGAMSATVS